MAPANGDLWPIRKGESSAKKTTDDSNVATTVQKRFSASCAKNKRRALAREEDYY